MKEIFKTIKNHPNYVVSNLGYVINKRNGYVLKPYLFPTGRQYQVYFDEKPHNLALLVLNHFSRKELGKDYAIHLNHLTYDNRVVNLKRSTRGDLLRHYYNEKKRVRGVYPYARTEKGKVYTYYRAVFKIGDRVVTIGYFKKKKDAAIAYKEAYLNQYGMNPY